MLNCLIYLLIFISTTSYAQVTSEVVEFSKTNQWKKIIYLEGEKSLVKGDHFFLASKSNWTALSELKATIEKFKKYEKHKNGELAECVFVARRDLILKRWPNLFMPTKCKQFYEWKSNLDAGDLYLVFTSAYPNNPASMFGHTFFRFDRKSKSQNVKTKELLGYAFSYQAQTNAEDNPLTYTFKGITGGYLSFLEIKPHYINVGIYNNSESRDTWEYKIDLTQAEKDMFLKHSWEISTTAAFDYYFLDENCSTLLLRHLEVVRPNVEFVSKNHFFVVPQVTLREVITKYNSDVYQYIPSIKRILENQFKHFNSKQKRVFEKAKISLSALEKTEDAVVLDSLIDYWKWKNYKEKTKLDSSDKKLMIKTLSKRSTIKTQSRAAKDKDLMYQRPDYGHKLSKLIFEVSHEIVSIATRYGFHDFYDYEVGNPESSYIKFLDFKLEKNNTRTNIRTNLIDILSLQNFYSEMPQLSWRVMLNYTNTQDESYTKLLSGIGAKNEWGKQKIFFLTTLNHYSTEDQSVVLPGLNLGYKLNLKEYKASKTNMVIELFSDNFYNKDIFYLKSKSALLHVDENKSYSLYYMKDFFDDRFGLEVSSYY